MRSGARLRRTEVAGKVTLCGQSGVSGTAAVCLLFGLGAPPGGWWWLYWFAFAPLLVVARHPLTRSWRQAAIYGFVGGDANQWGPNLFRNTTQIYPFTGKPDWNRLLNLPRPHLSADEQAFLDNETETLCRLLDDWQITL